MDEFSFGFYSGYLSIPGTTTKALHYVFAES
jgi:carboxypeptidase C (cathepsin A)